MRFTAEQIVAYNARIAADKARRATAGVNGSATTETPDSDLAERELQDLVARFLRIEGAWFLQQPFGRRTSAPPGCPDFLASFKGIFLAIECKVGHNGLTLEQEQVKIQIQAAGGEYLICRDLIEVKNLLRRVNARFDVAIP